MPAEIEDTGAGAQGLKLANGIAEGSGGFRTAVLAQASTERHKTVMERCARHSQTFDYIEVRDGAWNSGLVLGAGVE